MNNAFCTIHLLDGSQHHGRMVEIDDIQQQLLYRPDRQQQVKQLPLQQLSHLYYRHPYSKRTPLHFKLSFSDGRSLNTSAHGHRSDPAGDHLFQVGEPATDTHLFIPHNSPHRLTLHPQQASTKAPHQIINLADRIFEEAITQRASDIHMTPLNHQAEVSYRIDGERILAHRIHFDHYPALVSRIKILGNMDIAEQRRPQDGAHHLQHEGRKVDLRISTIPVLEGESVVIRVLDPRTGLRTLGEIGFRQEDEGLLREMLQRKSGLILVTGPTGSGKSTTLYAAMRELRARELNIISLEDPVEFRIDRIRQMEINEKSGNTYALNLPHVLRHDPDVILVGEIRDHKAAKMALQSAYTGHLVLSTLHTNDAPSTIPRLLEMGMEPYTLKDTLVGVLAQRLVRKVCTVCHNQLPAVKSCNHCNRSGFHGRLPLYELMPITPTLREQIREGVTAEEIRRCAVDSGMVTMENYAQTLIEQQTTLPQELHRNESP